MFGNARGNFYSCNSPAFCNTTRSQQKSLAAQHSLGSDRTWSVSPKGADEATAVASSSLLVETYLLLHQVCRRTFNQKTCLSEMTLFKTLFNFLSTPINLNPWPPLPSISVRLTSSPLFQGMMVPQVSIPYCDFLNVQTCFYPLARVHVE